jgi:sulfide dehydrogenase cytochrome subunit
MKTRFLLAALLLAVPPASSGAAVLPPLVAACAGCHRPSGGDQTLPRLAGGNASDIVAAMDAFRNGSRPATVMDRIAKGFTDDEIAAIAAWYAAQ